MNLSETEYRLLAIMGGNERSGREIAKLFRDETGKAISYGTLYTSFRRLAEKGFVRVRDDEDQDGRIRFFRITGAGFSTLIDARTHYSQLAALAAS